MEGQGMIQLEGVTKAYQMGKVEVPVLHGIDLTIDDGELVAIMGPSGSGKSTLMNILGCLDVPTNGRYLLDGTDVSRLSGKRLARVRSRKIGFVFQSFNLIPRTSAIRNVELPLIYAGVRERRIPARRALEQVGLSERQKHQPNELSGGQQQRVAIARALVARPKLILADEPTGNLDTANGDAVMQMLIDVACGGTTVIMVTHAPAYAALAQRTIKLLDGRVVSEALLAA
jgi:putative ABC transport system ATP-binding protein